MFTRTGKLFLVFFFFLSKVLCQTEAPIDLYLALDQSGSLSEARFRQLVDFGEALSFGVAEITGFYTDDSNGLRVGAVTFGCGTQTRERLAPTGDEETIRDRMDNMREFVQTYGETCLEPALQLLLGFKNGQAAISPPDRSTALVVLSDGRFDDFDDWQDEISTFMEERAQGFSVGIGDKIRESEMIAIADNNEDKYFKIDDPDALPTLIELIASMVINDFQIEIIKTDSGEIVNSTDELCVGQSVSAKIIGNSVQVFTESSDVTCDFIFSDGIQQSVAATTIEVDGQSTLVCENPDVSAAYDSVTVDLRINGNRVHSQVAALQRTSCIVSTKLVSTDVVESFQNCYGGLTEARIEYTGVTAELLLARIAALSCTVSFTAGASNTEQTIDGTIEELSNAAGFACLLPDTLFEIEKVNASSVLVEVLVDSDELGLLFAVQDTIDTSLRSDCLEIGLVNSQNDRELCLGDSIQLALSGETASNVISLIEQGTLTLQSCSITYNESTTDSTLEYSYDPVVNQLFCGLPYQFGIMPVSDFDLQFNLLFSTGREDILSFSVADYVLNECFEEGFPKKIVIQSTDGESVENERFCAGDGYDIEFSGQSADNLIQLSSNMDLNLELYCDFYKIDNPTVILFTERATQRSDNVLICSAIAWDPFDPVLADYYDFSEVKLVLRSTTEDIEAQSVDVDIYTGNSLCFDNPDHQVPDDFEPPELLSSSRALQDSCFPFCCRRPEVSIGFSGRTIAVVSAAQSDAAGSVLRCVYTTVEGSTIETEVILDGESASCAPAPGWRLRSDTGDYNLVELQLVEESGNIRTFSRFDYSPSTGSTNCVNNVPESFYCLGESVAFQSYGLTLLALSADETLTYDSDLFNVFLDGEALEVTILDDDRNTVLSRWQEFDDNRIITEADFQLNAEDVLLGNELFSDVVIENRDRCLGIVVAEATCGLLDEEEFFTSAVSGSGESLEFYPPSEGTYSCKFFTAESEIVDSPKITADVDVVSETVSCSILEQSPFSGYQVIYTNVENLDIVLKEGVITSSVTDCNDPIGGGDRGGPSSLDPLMYLLPIGLIALVVLIILLLVYKRRQDEKPLPIVGVVGSIFAVGDKVDIFVESIKLPEETTKALDSKGLKPENDGFWFRGTVANRTNLETSSQASSTGSDIESGEKLLSYDVTLDSSMQALNVPNEQLQHVILPNIRSALSSLPVGQLVAATGDKEVCQVTEILPNNKYAVSSTAKGVLVLDGSVLTPLKEMKFKVGDLVFFVAGASKYQSNGKVEEVDYVNQQYTVLKLDDGVKFTVPEDGVSELVYAAGAVVHVKVVEDEVASWKRGVVVKQLSEEKYQVRTGSSGNEKLVEVALTEIRNPKFEISDKVEVLIDSEKKEEAATNSEDWEPGYIKGVDEEFVNYQVFLTRKNKAVTAHASAIRKLEMEEVIKRIRRGVPLRSRNLDSSVPDSGVNLVPKDQRFKRKKPVDYTELPDHQFDITVDPSDGLGVKFGWTDEKVIVAGFRDMKNGDWGVLEATGLVMVKDQLVQIDNVLVANYGISDIAELIEKSKKKKKVTLRFGRSEEFKSQTSKPIVKS